MANHAVLLGINRCLDNSVPILQYAEKDCRDLAAALTNKDIGIFDDRNVLMLLGEEATTVNAKRLLQSHVVTERSPEDLVLVYFSGHGFVHKFLDRDRTYLGTYDFDRAIISKYPHEGLDMSFLHDDIFTATRAKSLLVVLDCCYSGAIVPVDLRRAEGMKDTHYTQKAGSRLDFLSGRLVSGSGRIALVACAAEKTSRESDEYLNGIFTHFFIRGLSGEAADAATGEVTLDSLSMYLKKNIPKEQEPVRYGQESGYIVLARTRKPVLETFEKDIFTHSAEPIPLSHSLEQLGPFIDCVLKELPEERLESPKDRERWILEAVRRASDADAAFLLVDGEKELIVNTLSRRNDSVDIDLGRVASFVAPKLVGGQLTRRSSHGMYLDDVYSETKKRLVVVPATFGLGSELLVLCGIEKDDLLVDAYGAVISAILSSGRSLKPGEEGLLEAKLLDELKKTYGFLPRSMYQRRLSLFLKRIRDVTIFFQPIVYIDTRDPRYDSWEALARDPRTGSVPKDLFDGAELWGRRFMKHLDCHLLRESVKRFHDELLRSNVASNSELSINIYPQSLMSVEYSRRLREVVEEGLIIPRYLVIEISEKVPIGELEDEGNVAVLEDFKDVLKEYVKKFNVTFAIDDFGVRHASVSRLARLNPAYVKIDRDVLLHTFAKLIVEFVSNLTKRDRLRHVKCVVEGFDSDSLISLRELYRSEIQYVQGFLFGRPQPEIHPIDSDTKDLIRKLLSVK